MVSRCLAIFRNSQDISDAAEWQLREELTASIPFASFEFRQFKYAACHGLQITQLQNFPITHCFTISPCSSSPPPPLPPQSPPQATSRWRPPASGTDALSPALARGLEQLALTYDDGPNDPHTQRLLEVLARHNVQATFFLIGRFVEATSRYRSRNCPSRPRHRQSHLHPSAADFQKRLRNPP